VYSISLQRRSGRLFCYFVNLILLSMYIIQYSVNRTFGHFRVALAEEIVEECFAYRIGH
jgi:hypothetical protein